MLQLQNETFGGTKRRNNDVRTVKFVETKQQEQKLCGTTHISWRLGTGRYSASGGAVTPVDGGDSASKGEGGLTGEGKK